MMFAEKKFMEVLSLLLEGGELVVEKLDEAQTAIVEKVKVLMRVQVEQEEDIPDTDSLKKPEKEEIKKEMRASQTQRAEVLGKNWESKAEKTEDPCIQGSIDYRVEMAMDLVKIHLMSAVRSEVDKLKDKIAKLEDDLRMKIIENDYFRQHASLEVLQGVPLPPRPAPLIVHLGQ